MEAQRASVQEQEDAHLGAQAALAMEQALLAQLNTAAQAAATAEAWQQQAVASAADCPAGAPLPLGLRIRQEGAAAAAAAAGWHQVAADADQDVLLAQGHARDQRAQLQASQGAGWG